MYFRTTGSERQARNMPAVPSGTKLRSSEKDGMPKGAFKPGRQRLKLFLSVGTFESLYVPQDYGSFGTVRKRVPIFLERKDFSRFFALLEVEKYFLDVKYFSKRLEKIVWMEHGRTQDAQNYDRNGKAAVKNFICSALVICVLCMFSSARQIIATERSLTHSFQNSLLYR